MGCGYVKVEVATQTGRCPESLTQTGRSLRSFGNVWLICLCWMGKTDQAVSVCLWLTVGMTGHDTLMSKKIPAAGCVSHR